MPIKKTKISVSIVVIIIGLFSIIALVLYSISIYNQKPNYYTPEKANKGEKIYSELSEIDFVNDYPQSPEEIVELNNKIMLFLYGNILADTRKISEVLEFQRNLFSTELNELNTLENQIENTNETFGIFLEKGVYVIDITQGSIKYTSQNDYSCSVTVDFYFNKLENIKKQYHLVKEDGRWKINNWSNI